jgi:hypothetical protein
MQEPCYTNKGPVSGIKSLHILLWDILIKKVASPHEASQNQGQGTILIRKKRALLPEDSVAKALSFEQASVTNSRNIPRVQTICSRIYPRVVLPGIRKGFHPVYAGHSPPFTV